MKAWYWYQHWPVFIINELTKEAEAEKTRDQNLSVFDLTKRAVRNWPRRRCERRALMWVMQIEGEYPEGLVGSAGSGEAPEPCAAGILYDVKEQVGELAVAAPAAQRRVRHAMDAFPCFCVGHLSALMTSTFIIIEIEVVRPFIAAIFAAPVGSITLVHFSSPKKRAA